MPALKNAVAGFQTGDLIITYLPRGGTRPMHVTIYLEPAVSPSNTHAFVHAAGEGLVIEGIEAWREMPKYRHARRTGALAREAAEAAKVWAADRTIDKNAPVTTPYGSYPGAKQSATPQLRANRFSAMMQTASIASIPLEAAGLVRLMKWTYRLHTRAPLSVNRGITCAAFSCACHQAAAMKLFLRDAGVLNDLTQSSMGKIDNLLESKAVLRERLKLPVAEPSEGVVTTKPILIGGALREHSNRGVTEKTQQALAGMNQAIAKKGDKLLDEYPVFFPDQQSVGNLTDTDRLWLAIQTKVLGMSTYLATRLADVIPQDFFYDAKYINSILLDELVRTSPHWNTTDYDTFD